MEWCSWECLNHVRLLLSSCCPSQHLCVSSFGGRTELSRVLCLPLQLGSFLPATGTGCPWRGSRKRGVGCFGGAKEQIVTGQNERGFDIKGGTVCFGWGRMRSVGQGGLFGQVQGVRFGVGVDVKLLRGRAQGVREWGWAVGRETWGRGRARGHGFGGGSDGAHTRRCTGVERVVRERVGRARGGRRGGGRRWVRGRRSLLLGGGIDVTGIRPIGGRII